MIRSGNYSQITYQNAVASKTRDNSHSTWQNFAGLAVIIGLLAVPVFKGLWQLWHCDKNFYGLSLVPFMFGLILYRSNDELARCIPKQVKWILYLLPLVLGVMLVASNYNFSRIAGLLLVVNLLIASLGTFGYSNYRLFVGPLIFLTLMVPPPQFAVDFVTINLQKLFSTVTEITLFSSSDSFLGRYGFEFRFTGIDYPMVIASECSGIRSLLGFVIVPLFFVIFDRHSITTAMLMILAGVATSLVLNFLRILVTIQMRLNGFDEYSVGSWHGLLGIAAFMIGCLALSILSRFLKSVD